jgi:hypothetical protein
MRHLITLVFLLAFAPLDLAWASEREDIDNLRQLLEDLRSDYEARISALESRLAEAERATKKAERAAEDAFEVAEETAIAAGSGQVAANAFNPAIGAVLVGRWADLDGTWDAIPGFGADGELGPGESGFSLGESEVNFKAAIDARFFGNLTLALEDEAGETEVGVEEAWIQTLALPRGLMATAGRYFSGVGYLNKFHRHADDFADRPLPYQAFFGGQYIADGAQLRWVAPTSLFVEIGAEFNWGDRFPATGGGASPDAWDVFAHLGGDVGNSHSWQLGMSYLSMDVEDRSVGEGEQDSFTGDSELAGVDFVWKWAPEGNSAVRNLKLQAEYFFRDEDGELGDTPYDGDQDGWYLQGVWQFMPQWRVGYRHDEVDSDNGARLTGTALEDPEDQPRRDSLMIDWSASEFSRVRLQYVYDRVLSDSDNQLVLQYIMSLGAHGGHEF